MKKHDKSTEVEFTGAAPSQSRALLGAGTFHSERD
jgi:hypothetical protein